MFGARPYSPLPRPHCLRDPGSSWQRVPAHLSLSSATSACCTQHGLTGDVSPSPAPLPRSQNPPQPQPRGQGSSTDPKGLQAPSPTALRTQAVPGTTLGDRVQGQEWQGAAAQDRRWQSQTKDPRLDRAVGSGEGAWAQRSWVVMPSSRQRRAAGGSLRFPQRTHPCCYLMRELAVAGRQDC